MSFLTKRAGITTLDALLAVLLIAAIAGMGYFAYEAHTNKTDRAAEKSAGTAQPDTAASPPGRSPTATNLSDFKIPELGVQFTVPADLAGLTYAIDAGSNGSSGSATDYGLTTPAVASFGQACSAASGGAGFLNITNATISSGNTTIYQVPASNGEVLAYSEPLVSCGARYPNYGTQQKNAVLAIKQALITVRPLQ